MRKIIRCIEALSIKVVALEREIAALRGEVSQMRAQQMPPAEKPPGIVKRVFGLSCKHARSP
jgi:hypothetical protein